MWRPFWALVAVSVFFAVLTAWLSASATFLFVHPGLPGVRMEVDSETGGAVVVAGAKELKVAKLAAEPGRRNGALPKLRADKLEHDFGIMDPLTEGKHEFVLRNVGQAPMKLTVGPTTCKCTVSGLDKREVAPGDQAKVTLEWNTGTSVLYSHAATIYTNDPDRKSLDVRVSGKVRMRLGADVEELVFPDVKPNTDAVAECFLYTQLWNDFDVQAVESQIAGLKWEVTKAGAKQAQEMSANAVQRLRIVLPAASLARRFHDTLRIQVKPEGTGEAATLDLPLLGNVLGPYAVFGGDFVDGAVELGSIPWGQGRKSKFMIKIRDADLDLGNVKIEVNPSFVQARLVRGEGSVKGLYDLHLELPSETAVCQYLGTPQGELTIETGHPRIGTLKFPVRFAVVEKRF